MQVIYQCTAMLRSWPSLYRVEHRDLFTEVSTRLEDTARDIFSIMDAILIFGLNLHHNGCSYILHFLTFWL
jgi:hypothetical protein